VTFFSCRANQDFFPPPWCIRGDSLSLVVSGLFPRKMLFRTASCGLRSSETRAPMIVSLSSPPCFSLGRSRVFFLFSDDIPIFFRLSFDSRRPDIGEYLRIPHPRHLFSFPCHSLDSPFSFLQFFPKPPLIFGNALVFYRCSRTHRPSHSTGRVPLSLCVTLFPLRKLPITQRSSFPKPLPVRCFGRFESHPNPLFPPSFPPSNLVPSLRFCPEYASPVFNRPATRLSPPPVFVFTFKAGRLLSGLFSQVFSP